MSFLVDTNVLSELARSHPNANVTTWLGGLDRLALSVITVEEIAFGLAAKPNPHISAWFDAFIARHCQVLEITAPIARHAGILRGDHATRGRVRTQADMLIAATAVQHGLTLATRNEKDFQGCSVSIVNPFRSGGAGKRRG